MPIAVHESWTTLLESVSVREFTGVRECVVRENVCGMYVCVWDVRGEEKREEKREKTEDGEMCMRDVYRGIDGNLQDK